MPTATTLRTPHIGAAAAVCVNHVPPLTGLLPTSVGGGRVERKDKARKATEIVTELFQKHPPTQTLGAPRPRCCGSSKDKAMRNELFWCVGRLQDTHVADHWTIQWADSAPFSTQGVWMLRRVCFRRPTGVWLTTACQDTHTICACCVYTQSVLTFLLQSSPAVLV